MRIERPGSFAGYGSGARTTGGGLPRIPSFGRSVFPDGAAVRIFRPGRSAMTSGPGPKGWRLVFERRSPPTIEPLMGWTGGDDTLTQVELSFPTLQAATAYAERQGLAYVVEMPPPTGMGLPRERGPGRRPLVPGDDRPGGRRAEDIGGRVVPGGVTPPPRLPPPRGFQPSATLERRMDDAGQPVVQ